MIGEKSPQNPQPALTPAFNTWFLGIELRLGWTEGALRDKTGAASLGNFRAKGWAHSTRGLVCCCGGVDCLEAVNLAADWSDLRSCIFPRNFRCFHCSLLLLSRMVQEKAR